MRALAYCSQVPCGSSCQLAPLPDVVSTFRPVRATARLGECMKTLKELLSQWVLLHQFPSWQVTESTIFKQGRWWDSKTSYTAKKMCTLVRLNLQLPNHVYLLPQNMTKWQFRKIPPVNTHMYRTTSSLKIQVTPHQNTYLPTSPLPHSMTIPDMTVTTFFLFLPACVFRSGSTSEATEFQRGVDSPSGSIVVLFTNLSNRVLVKDLLKKQLSTTISNGIDLNMCNYLRERPTRYFNPIN